MTMLSYYKIMVILRFLPVCYKTVMLISAKNMAA